MRRHNLGVAVPALLKTVLPAIAAFERTCMTILARLKPCASLSPAMDDTYRGFEQPVLARGGTGEELDHARFEPRFEIVT